MRPKKKQPFGCFFCCERDSSGTTEGHEMPEGDGADSPTRAGKAREAARPKEFCEAKFNEE